MTYGVPYSFVPGTKAKADEVNANFIDILDKIEVANTRIDDVNLTTSQNIEQLGASKLDLDLSNISEEGQQLFNKKADATLLDGAWGFKFLTLAEDVAISLNTTKTHSLSSYLPKDGALYEVRCSFWAQGGSANNDACQINLTSDKIASYTGAAFNVSRTSGRYYTTNNMIMLVGPSRWIKVIRSGFGSGTTYYTLQLNAYRKVR